MEVVVKGPPPGAEAPLDEDLTGEAPVEPAPRVANRARTDDAASAHIGEAASAPVADSADEPSANEAKKKKKNRGAAAPSSHALPVSTSELPSTSVAAAPAPTTTESMPPALQPAVSATPDKRSSKSVRISLADSFVLRACRRMRPRALSGRARETHRQACRRGTGGSGRRQLSKRSIRPWHCGARRPRSIAGRSDRPAYA